MEKGCDTTGLLSLLRAGNTVLLPNARAAQQLRWSFDQAQRRAEASLWEPPAAFAWHEWLDLLWSRPVLAGEEDRILLNPLQEERVWERIIAASPEGDKLPRASLGSLGRLASSAFALACAHEGISEIQRTADSPDAHAFAIWQRHFGRECVAERLLPRALLPAALAAHVRAGTLTAPDTLHLAGFEELTPAQLSLLQAFRRAGGRVQSYSLEAMGDFRPPGRSVELPSPGDEVRWAANWLRKQFGPQSDPPLRVALVLPDPGGERAAMEPVLREVLAPELEPVGVDLSSVPWHFNAGAALGTLPLIRDALLLLKWLDEAISPDEIGTLLLSPYFEFGEEFEQLAHFEGRSVRGGSRLNPELDLSALLQSALRRGLQLTQLQAVLRLAGESAHRSGTALHAEWADLVRKLLKVAGWPGSRTLTPAEFSATEAWDGTLDLLATLDVLGERVSFPDWREKLSAQAAASASRGAISGAAVEVLRLDEAEGCCFDVAVLLHATDNYLPPPVPLHPLLGWEFHRLLHLPGFDASATYARSRRQLSFLRQRCGDLMLVHAQADAHGPLRCTALATEMGFRAVEATDLLPAPAEASWVELRAIEETEMIPLLSLEIGGGARLLELQAACGFRAFATLRLGATTPEQTTLGLDARDRGKLLHKALELFWREVRSQASLRSLTPSAREDAVRSAVAAAFTSLRLGSGATAWQSAYLKVCERRVSGLLQSWLTHELLRSDFEVLTQEEDRFVQVGPLTLKVRPDRVDRVEGGFVFVDYKTSAQLSTEHWLGDRPQAPQLPLYTLLHDADEVRALAFARLRPGPSMKWIGLQREQGDLRHGGGIRLHDLSFQVMSWRAELDRLAEDFAAGVVNINPKAYPKTCEFCEQNLLCRLKPETLLAQTDVEDDHEGSMEEQLG